MLMHPVPYDPDWPVRFANYQAQLVALTGLNPKAIAHIGSTAVPGIWAKPIIDVQISVVDLATFDLSCLASDPFQPVAHIDRDDPFPDTESGHQGWRKKYARMRVGDTRLAHIHVRQIGNPNHRFALLFRDFLRANATPRDLYSDFKRRAADISAGSSDAGGGGDYLGLKDPFVRLIAHQSEHWAAQTGWTLSKLA